MTWYDFFRPVAKGLSAAFVRLTVEGRSNVPLEGPFVLIANHQSVLDPMLVQAHCPRDVYSFAKSTQFSSGAVSRWLLPRINAIPARRYRIDPQVVRTALRLLDRGEVVGIYPEGERSWDGALQPLRRGTVRLILKAGVCVVPCGVVRSFDAWPRWSRRPRRLPVRLRFGPPIHFGRHDTRAEREAVLEETAKRLTAILAEISEDPRSTAPGPADAPVPARPQPPAEPIALSATEL